MEKDQNNLVLREVFFQVLLVHPLPWKVERDWTYEVIANDGVIVAKCKSNEDAETVIEFAKEFKAKLDADGEKVEEFLKNTKNP